MGRGWRETGWLHVASLECFSSLKGGVGLEQVDHVWTSRRCLATGIENIP